MKTNKGFPIPFFLITALVQLALGIFTILATNENPPDYVWHIYGIATLAFLILEFKKFKVDKEANNQIERIENSLKQIRKRLKKKEKRKNRT